MDKLMRFLIMILARPVAMLFGPTVKKILDKNRVCRCSDCCGSGPFEFTPCENKVAVEGSRYCNWCLGAQAGEYEHCHGMGNAMLRAGWRLGRENVEAGSPWPR